MQADAMRSDALGTKMDDGLDVGPVKMVNSRLDTFVVGFEPGRTRLIDQKLARRCYDGLFTALEQHTGGYKYLGCSPAQRRQKANASLFFKSCGFNAVALSAPKRICCSRSQSLRYGPSGLWSLLLMLAFSQGRTMAENEIRKAMTGLRD
ncbi:hypothetical protein B0O99DRAFT_592360 [Bisporella sp. PMI_857]|nr:hypothetical protein B0O99DRAFT_592360 [Bisporella sp. PMI_857]